MKDLETILETFSSITLKEMDKVKLMDRTDTKFIFHLSELPGILQMLSPFYRALNIESKIISQYKTLYYDTPDLFLYHRHRCGKLNRYKIRHRTYVESKTGFLEVKFKNNKGRTLKERIKVLNAPAQWEEESKKFLELRTPYDPMQLEPVIWVNYQRFTLINKSGPERLTIDINLEFVKDERAKNIGSLVIAEVKQESKALSPFIKLMKEKHIQEGSISKYCMGIAMTINNVKTNSFKPKLIKINNLIRS